MSEFYLKPCPFCGGRADLEEVTPEKYPVTTWGVSCANEEVDCIASGIMSTFSRKVEAAEAWNKRVVVLDLDPVKRIG